MNHACAPIKCVYQVCIKRVKMQGKILPHRILVEKPDTMQDCNENFSDYLRNIVYSLKRNIFEHIISVCVLNVFCIEFRFVINFHFRLYLAYERDTAWNGLEHFLQVRLNLYLVFCTLRATLCTPRGVSRVPESYFFWRKSKSSLGSIPV